MRSTLRAIARGAALFCCLAAFVFSGADPTAAGITGSLHDWSATGPQAPAIPANGTCSFCHVSHAAVGPRLWTGRNTGLTDEITYYNQTLDPNYIPAETLLCYDCHDDATTVDNDPDSGFWRNGRRPQDVALFGTNVGYYELIDGTDPSPAPAPIDGSATGGHYWKSVPVGTGAPERGDKIRCSLCHDPHKARTGANEVFFLTETWIGNSSPVILGNNLKASPSSREHTTGTGREMCAACHQYSDSGTPESFWGKPVPAPSVALSQHSVNDTTTPCTSCHRHNKIVARCDDCHGNPPITAAPWAGPGSTGESYPGSAGAHLAHIKGAGMLVTDPDVYSFGCLGGSCHPSTTHNEGNGTVIRGNVQVAFRSPANPAGDAWNPNGVYTQGGTPPLDSCTQLYCHSNALVENGLNPADNGTGQGGPSGRGEYAESAGMTTFYGTTPAKPATWGGSLDCKGCHGKGDPDVLKEMTAGNTSTPVSSPDYLNAGAAPVGPYNTTGSNTHFIHVYKLPNSSGGTCSCHGTADSVTRPAAGHVNRQIEVTACAALCHNGGNWGDKHGTTPGADNCTNSALAGMGCHGKDRIFDSPGGRITRPANASNPQDNQLKYMQSGHGLPAASTYASGNSGADLGCEACHLATDRLATNGPLEASYHYERDPMATGNAGAALATNPYWLKAPYANDPDGLCDSCHAASSTARNHTAQNMWNFARYNPKYDTGSNPPPPVGPWSSFTPNCVSCHDPHGEPNWYMLYDGDAEKSASSASATMEYSGPVIYKGDRFGVTRAQSNAYGFPPGPNYAANQTPVAMTGDTSGSDFVNGSNTGICQVCHTQTTYYRRDGSNPGGAHISTLCTDCHKHPTAFAPTGCEGCHGKECNVSTGVDGSPGTADDAPNVITTSCPAGNPDGSPTGPGVSVWDGTWWDTNQGGNNATQQGGHGDADGLPAVGCTECHDIADPPNTHMFDVGGGVGQYNSLGTEIPMPQAPWNRAVARPKANPNANTSHLVPGYFTGASGNNYSWQVAMDKFCSDCHALGTNNVADMRHERDTTSGDPNYHSVELGTHLTKTGAPPPPSETVTVPMDSDLTTNAGGAPHYAPCGACHNPHGTTTTDVRGGGPNAKNRMLIDAWFSQPSLCLRCHQ
ncbi:MAG: hypothetical protein HY825_00470 [Acidobacteria bacterium]|nr:hypothetical protein [Acidobacteriota bacterium]